MLAVTSLWAVAGPALAQGTGSGGQPPTTGGQGTAATAGTAGKIVVRSQDVDNGQVVVDSFNAPADGWLLIQKSSNGRPGAVIGWAPVFQGLNQGIRISVQSVQTRHGSDNATDNSNITSTLFASFAPDANATNPLTSPPAGVEQSATVLAAFGSTAASNAGLAGQPATTGGVSNASRIVANAQNVTANHVTISSVNAAQDGWLLIRSGSEFGPVIGWAPVHQGLNQGVGVTIQLSRRQATSNPDGSVNTDRDLITPQLWATLVADPNAANPFATPSSDVQNAVPYAATAFSTTAQQQAGTALTTGGVSSQTTQGTPSQAPSTAAPAAPAGANQIVVRPQDITANQVFVDSVTAAQDGWLLIHTDAGGRPGAVIGWAPVFKGLNQGVRVDIQLSRHQTSNAANSGRDYITSVLWATLNPDPSAVTPFATPSDAVQTSGAIQVPFSSTAAGGVGAGANQGSTSGSR